MKEVQQIKFKQAHGEMGSADTDGAGEWLSAVLLQLAWMLASSKRPCLEDGSEHKESDSDNDAVEKITHTTARHSVQVFEQYFVEQGFSGAHHAALDTCANEVVFFFRNKLQDATD